MKTFYINCSVLLAFMLFSGKCLAVFETEAQMMEAVPKILHHYFEFMSGTPAGFTRNDKNVFNLYRLCQIYLEDGSPELLAEISRRLSSSYITHNFPPYFKENLIDLLGEITGDNVLRIKNSSGKVIYKRLGQIPAEGQLEREILKIQSKHIAEIPTE